MKFVLPILSLLAALPSFASGTVADCEALAARAGHEAGIPTGLLPAIARMESGHSFRGEPRRAWPWTLNEGGQSHYFESQYEALTYLQSAIDRGVTNIDVGCMQINYRWHYDNFASLDAMLDPEGNTQYGAEFLAELNRRLGSWDHAVARYHSADASQGQSYQIAVADIFKTLTHGVWEFDGPQAMTVGFMTAHNRPLVDLGQTVSSYLEQGFHDLEAAATHDSTFVDFRPVTVLLLPHEVSPRLERDWSKIETFRAMLSD